MRTVSGLRSGRLASVGILTAAILLSLAFPASALAATRMRLQRLTTALIGASGQRAMATGDIDADGREDDAIVVYPGTPCRAGVFLGNGTDLVHVADVLLKGNDVRDIALADFDKDGKNDIAYSDAGWGVEVRKGDGTGAFADWPVLNWQSIDAAEDLFVSDLNADGRPDVAVVSGGTDDVYVMLTDAAGVLGAPVVYHTGLTQVTKIAPVGADIAVLSKAGKRLTVLVNDPVSKGTFPTVRFIASTGNAPEDVCGIGDPVHGYSVLVANTGDDDVRWYYNIAAAVPSTVDIPTLNAPYRLAARDLSADRVADVAVTCATGTTQSSVFLLEATNGGATFGGAGIYPVSVSTGALPVSLGLLDFTYEGKADVVMTTSDGRIHRFRNTTVPLFARLVGKEPNRYSTAVRLAEAFSEGTDTVVLASGENYPDALCGVPLAYAMNAPMLLVKKYSVPAEVKAKIAAYGATHAVLLGGTGAVSAEVQQYLKDACGLDVERIAGENRYETSYRIAKRMLAEQGAPSFYFGHVATGENYPDALAAAGFAAFREGPILLVTKDSVPSWTAKALAELKWKHTLVCGGTGAISAPVAARFPNPVRKGGANRYETARLIAAYSLLGGFERNQIFVATGENFPDALCVGPLCALRGRPLLLTGSATLPAATKQAIVQWGPGCTTAYVIGGSGAVSDGVVSAMRSAY